MGKQMMDWTSNIGIKKWQEELMNEKVNQQMIDCTKFREFTLISGLGPVLCCDISRTACAVDNH